MIILDPRDTGQGAKEDRYEGITLRHPQAAFTRSSSPLPDYDASEAQHWGIVDNSKDDLVGVSKKKNRLLSPRVLRFAFLALSVYAVLSIIAVVTFVIIKHKQKMEASLWNNNPPSLWATEDKDYTSQLQIPNVGPPLALEDNKTCNVWQTFTGVENGASSNFSLPPSGLISIRSNATYNAQAATQIGGMLSVYTNKDVLQKNILLSVNLQASSSELLNRTNVCFSLKGLDRGLSIYVPPNLTAGDYLNLNIKVALPQTDFRVNNFVTYLPMLRQTFYKLYEDAYFDHFGLEGAGSPISCKYLQASQISIKNIGASIEGAFNVTNALSLDTVKGSVSSDVTLTSPPYIVQPGLLSINTGDSPIDANITLQSHPSQSKVSSSSPPAFVAKVSNFNAPMKLKVSHSTNTTQALQLMVINNSAETSVNLDSAFAGTFSAKTKMSRVTVSGLGPNSTNSTSHDKVSSRTVMYKQNTVDAVVGWTGWNTNPPMRNSHKAQSYVDVVSALGPVSLSFG
ncbi:hypothetical protein D9613_000396 [Agrocybe pediades]|uniref:Uncharacterized protein n=1 Tax=Agrocybe pediades TaxID=84607 RepID=A0A8H4R1B7_9AGAR|nr:hypothetical protein D9613_000396 [Agrocybe pediades]